MSANCAQLTVLSVLHINTLNTVYKGGTAIDPILQMKKLSSISGFKTIFIDSVHTLIYPIDFIIMFCFCGNDWSELVVKE